MRIPGIFRTTVRQLSCPPTQSSKFCRAQFPVYITFERQYSSVILAHRKEREIVAHRAVKTQLGSPSKIYKETKIFRTRPHLNIMNRTQTHVSNTSVLASCLWDARNTDAYSMTFRHVPGPRSFLIDRVSCPSYISIHSFIIQTDTL